MSKQRVVNSKNLQTKELVGSLVRGYGRAINNKKRYEISCCDYADSVIDLYVLKGVLDTDYCYLEHGDKRDVREMIINKHAKNIKEL